MSFKSVALWIIVASLASIAILFGIFCGILAGSGMDFVEAGQSFERLTAATPIVGWLRTIGVWGAIIGGALWLYQTRKR